MAQSSRTFRVFVSSTFRDLKEERNALEREVFPKLRELCARQNCRFQAIDLRWGVSEEAGLDHRTMRICLDEIARCQSVTPRPNFLILMGDRYGWQPLPEEIPAAEFEAIRQVVTDHNDERLLLRWYRLDDNARPPVYCLQPRTIDLGRDQTEQDQNEAHRAEAELWKHIETSLWRMLHNAIDQVELSDEHKQKYQISATEQEIMRGALSVDDANEHVFCFFRRIENLSPEAHDYFEPDSSARGRLRQLKEGKLRARLPNNIHDYEANWIGNSITTDHLPQLCADVYTSLSRVIQQEIDRLSDVDPMRKEIEDHETFARDRACTEFFVGRDDILRTIRDYVRGTDSHPLAIVGVSGSGKTALIGQAIQQAGSEIPAAKTVVRFIGATVDSCDVRSLLEALCHQISEIYGDHTSVPKGYVELVEAFPKRLELARADAPLVMFLDALDQLTDAESSRTLSWLPTELPEHVRIVVSTVPGECASPLEKTLPEASLLNLPPLSPSEGSLLLDRWLEDAGRELQPRQRGELLEKFERSRLPLFLKLGFEEARRWRSYEEPAPLGVDVQGIIGNLFARLEHPANHGAVMVRHSLGYLSAARHGLSEDELLDVLSADQAVLTDLRRRSPESPNVDRLPVVIWSRLYFDLAPFLSQRDTNGVLALTFNNQPLKEGAQARYLSGADDLRERHRTLAHYFRLSADPGGESRWDGLGRRGFSELAFHLYSYSRSAADNHALYELAHDPKFRERQFVVLEKLEPVLECMNFAIEQATISRDAVFTIRLSFTRARLNLTLARTFLYQLPSLAESNPRLAISVAELIPTSADRFLALTLVAWICADHPDRHAAARRLLADLKTTETASVRASQIPVLLWMIRDMVEQGVDEARELVRLIPDCPLRQICQLVWEDSSPPLSRLAASLAQPVQTKVSSTELDRASQVDRYARQCWDDGRFHRFPARVEEKAVHRFGEKGSSEFWVLTAARSLVTGHKEEARLMLNRGLYLTQGIRQQPLRTQLALTSALAAAGEQELSRENRDKVTSHIQTMFWFTSDEATRRELAPIVDDLAGWHNEVFLRDTAFPRLQKVARETLASAEGDSDQAIELMFRRATQTAAAGRLPEASEELNQVLASMDIAPSFQRTAVVLIATFALAEAVGNDAVRTRCLTELLGQSLQPELLFTGAGLIEGKTNALLEAVFDALLLGDATNAAAVAVALRLRNRHEVLFAFVERTCRRGADARFLDAVASQIPLLEMVDTPTLRRIDEEINLLDARHGVSVGLGMYYFVFLWLYLTSVGILCVALGGTAKAAYAAGAALIAGGILGAIYDLFIWRKMGVWQKPERSRHLAAEAGTGLAIWGTLLFLQPDLSRMFSSDAVGYAFCGTLVSAVLLFVGLALISYNWGISKRARSILVGITMLASALAVIFSTTLEEQFGSDSLTGIFLAGSLMLGVGLNLVIKHIPVRMFYKVRGIKLGDDVDSDKLADFKLSHARTDNTRLEKEILKADRALIRHQNESAYRQFTRIIGDPDFDSQPAETQALVHMNRGVTCRALRKLSAAIADYQHAAKLNPRSPSSHLNMGLVFAQDLGDFRRGSAAFTEAIKRDPNNPESFSSRALTRTELHDYSGAQKDLECALLLDSHLANALSNLGNLMITTGRIGEATERFGKALAEAPRDFQIRFNYALALARGGRHEEAQRILRQDPRALRLWHAKSRGGHGG